ncbi:GntP family gluconate:H+ symporter [Lipingzhangella halophila]|uniref:GntP family gluconate:H+ symporter n=1 Tax=Lipingzhangella halophila TaxID=1783352 RepID=A0A7W7RJG6_9ACTN|nr:GntP family permease [Lipingzhangella halophila]MBB4933050.1 GntP family gluconate:H+ symporter [Lipingzhangella halophila]
MEDSIDPITNNPAVALIGFVAVIVVLLFLIAKFKWHVFIALLVPIVLLGLVPTVDQTAFIEAFEVGFGGTIQSIAVVIVLGTLIAEALRNSGAVERITHSMMRLVGKRNMPLALTLAGFVIGLAVFSDIGYIILNPLVHVAALEAGATMSVMATGLVGAMQLTHAIVPPTPGPLAAAAVVEADIGRIILYGSIVTLFGSVMGWLYAKIVGPRITSPPSEEYRTTSLDGDTQRLPSTWWSYAPILVPLVLIGGSSVADFALSEDNPVHGYAMFLGWPVFALGIGVLLAYFVAWRNNAVEGSVSLRDTWVENALRTSAMVIMVTGLGGALSELLKATPAVDVIAENTLALGIPAILLPFLLGVLANLITGSTTVGVITAASLTAPMLPTLGLSPEAAMLSAACGSVIIKYVNSSYFWVCMTLSGMSLRAALVSYGGVTLVGGISSMCAVSALWGFGVI